MNQSTTDRLRAVLADSHIEALTHTQIDQIVLRVLALTHPDTTVLVVRERLAAAWDQGWNAATRRTGEPGPVNHPDAHNPYRDQRD